MRALILVCFVSLFCFVLSKNNVKSLTDNTGQEVIEIEGPKELPPGLEEEPAADSDDDIKPTGAMSTKKDVKKTTTLPDGRRKLKDVEKIDGLNAEDEEARLEKELAEIYKDTDYKDNADEPVEQTEAKETETTTSSSSEAASSTTEPSTEPDTDKPVARQRTSFKFEPESSRKADVERFRTSVDDITCNKKTKLKNDKGSASSLSAAMSLIQIGTAVATVLCLI
ncbi:uncharacterized protein LOC142985563 [Anticarsia gemmatalis]|uniref:uncharacterized protein LOC142985563 n=1 Tax=Anticarsia gemmatalis TaxID=129554 RepID=UPI003F773C55